jgi:hypothetical protein
MFSKLFIILSHFVYSDTPVAQQEKVIVVTVPEDEIVIENIKP